MTANQLAKLLLYEYGVGRMCSWEGDGHVDMEKITAKEIEAINDAYYKQQRRVYKFLGIRKIETNSKRV